ncbi:MAG TPA: glycosyltransferase family 4 protein [Candidatus Dormibacteraeota bacterium]|nr:glycosyltransferase family 4 protein [Candidatus Dormibacteraeota bacterium]
MTRLRIGWLGHDSETIGDGLRTYSRNVTAGLAKRGAEIVFVHHEKALDDGRLSFSLMGTPVFQRRVVIAHRQSRRRLESILREQRVDVVHLSAPFSTLDFAIPRLCHALGVPIVVTFHVPFAMAASRWSMLASVVYRLYARTLAECDQIIVLGAEQRNLLVDLGVPRSRITVLPNGVDLEKYSPGPSVAREAFGAERIFCFVGRVDPEKRVDQLVLAFLAALPPLTTRLLIVGDGVELARLRRRYVDPRVVFTGAILDERSRVDILRASDAFFLPSHLEAHSLALLEAMACGIAVVATAVGNHVEMVDGAGMLLNPHRLTAELDLAMRDLIESPELCRVLGAQARKRAEVFALGTHVDGLFATYGSVICGRAGGSQLVRMDATG